MDDITALYRGLKGPALDLKAGASVTLPVGMAGAGKVALVREVYLRIRERLLAMPPGLACVYGTPGVGKSIFASLFVLSLAGVDDGSVFYTAYGSPSVQSAWCLRGGCVFNVHQQDLTSALGEADCGDKLSWLVVDGRPCGEFVFAPTGSLRVVLVSSANLANQRWLREVDKMATLRLLMPPFSCSELEGISGAQSVRERFAQFGGSARLVLGGDSHVGWARTQVRGLGAQVLQQIMRDVEEGSSTERASSRILHLFLKPAADTGGGEAVADLSALPADATTAAATAASTAAVVPAVWRATAPGGGGGASGAAADSRAQAPEPQGPSGE